LKYFRIDDVAIKEVLESYVPENNRIAVVDKSELTKLFCHKPRDNEAIENSPVRESKYAMILGDMFDRESGKSAGTGNIDLQ
jgi:UDP-N-acetylmuramoyl-tripeptide--D-alanyl-D-alanine ligase